MSLYEDSVAIGPDDIVVTERTVVGTAAFEGGPLSDREFGTTVRNFATGDFDPESLVTSRIELEEIVEDGFERLMADGSNEVKVLVRP